MAISDYERIEKAIRDLAENFPDRPSLEESARRAGLSPFHFQRLFTRWAGISPKRFLRFLAAERARHLLEESPALLEAAGGAGLSGPGRLHDLVVSVHAVTPGEMKRAGEGLVVRYGTAPTPFGDALLGMTERGICALTFLPAPRAGDPVADLSARWGRATLVEDRAAAEAVAGRIFGPWRRDPSLRLNVVLRGTNFQLKVWEALLRIPPGRVASYGDVAAAIGSPRAARAVGNAVGDNPVAFLIPCHRVIRETGALGNYGGGAARKKAMLAWEAARYARLGGGNR